MNSMIFYLVSTTKIKVACRQTRSIMNRYIQLTYIITVYSSVTDHLTKNWKGNMSFSLPRISLKNSRAIFLTLVRPEYTDAWVIFLLPSLSLLTNREM